MSDIQDAIDRTENAISSALIELGDLEALHGHWKDVLVRICDFAENLNSNPERTSREVETISGMILQEVRDLGL